LVRRDAFAPIRVLGLVPRVRPGHLHLVLLHNVLDPRRVRFFVRGETRLSRRLSGGPSVGEQSGRGQDTSGRSRRQTESDGQTVGGRLGRDGASGRRAQDLRTEHRVVDEWTQRRNDT